MSKKKRWVWFGLSLIAFIGSIPIISTLSIPVEAKIIIFAVLGGLWVGLTVYLLSDK